MSDSRIEKTKKNFIYAVILQISKLLLVFINRIIFVKILGSVYLGINGLFSNILSMLSIADLGITTAMMYSLYKPLAEHDEDKVSMYIHYFKKVYNIIALIVLVLGIILIPFLRYIVNLPENVDHIYLYYMLLVVNTALTYLYIYKTTLLSADQKMYIISKYDTIFQFVMFVMQIIVLVVTKSFMLYLLSNLICTLLGNVFKARETDKLYPYLKNNTNLISKKEKNEIYKNVKSLFIYKIGGVIQSNTDNILISIFAGTILVGYYSNYSTIILTVTSFISLIFNAIKASLGNYINTNDKKEQLKLFYIFENFNFWVVGFCSICFIELIPLFVRICFGEEYIMSDMVLLAAVAIFYTQNIRQTIWMYRETTGLFNKTKYISLITSSLNLLFSIILGYYYKTEGVLIATVISNMIYAWWKEPILLFKEYFNSSPKKYFLNYIVRLVFLIGILVLLEVINKIIYVDNIYLCFITRVIVDISISTLILFTIYRKTETFKFMKEKILRRGRNNE